VALNNDLLTSTVTRANTWCGLADDFQCPTPDMHAVHEVTSDDLLHAVEARPLCGAMVNTVHYPQVAIFPSWSPIQVLTRVVVANFVDRDQRRIAIATPPRLYF
jgi:hypothetical protein